MIIRMSSLGVERSVLGIFNIYLHYSNLQQNNF